MEEEKVFCICEDCKHEYKIPMSGGARRCKLLGINLVKGFGCNQSEPKKKQEKLL